MAKEGKKLELFEVLAAKKNKGKSPLGLGGKPAAPANKPGAAEKPAEIVDRPGLIIDDAVSPEMGYAPVPEIEEPQIEEPLAPSTPPVQDRPVVREAPVREAQRYVKPPKQEKKPPPVQEYREPEPEPPPPPKRPRSPREVVISIETALFFFGVVLILLWTAFGVGYKRGREERPIGLAELANIETMDRDTVSIRGGGQERERRTTEVPPGTDFTLIIRKEPVTDALLERLDLELREALVSGMKQTGMDFPGFIFRTGGNDPHYILAVGLGANSTDPDLLKLQRVYDEMDNILLSQQPKPYLGCRTAKVSELGALVM